MPPFFSVVIPAFNRSALIEGALNSVLGQTFTDFEIIVVDDGSADDTVQVANAILSGAERPFKILSQSNAGPGAARNNGIRHAAGQYIAFLDSDDVWFPWTLASYHQAIHDFDRPGFLCGIPIDVRPGEQVNADGSQNRSVEQHADFYSMPGNPFFRFTTSGVAIRKESLDRVNGFAVEGFEDLDLWMRLGTEKGFLLITQPPVVVRRLFGNNLSDSRKYNQSGTRLMISSEKTGRYPGGAKRRGDRRRLLATLMRAASMQTVKSGNVRLALWIYFQIFFWSVGQLRVRYLLGLPLEILLVSVGVKR